MSAEQCSEYEENGFNKKIIRRVGMCLLAYSGFMGAFFVMGTVNETQYQPDATSMESGPGTAGDTYSGPGTLVSLGIISATGAAGYAMIRRPRQRSEEDPMHADSNHERQLMPEQLPPDIAQAIERKLQKLEFTPEYDVEQFYDQPDKG